MKKVEQVIRALPLAMPGASVAVARLVTRLRRGDYVIAIGTVVVVLMLAAAAVSILTERANALAFWRSAAEGESRTLAAHARQTLVSADLVLRSVIDRANDAQVRDVGELRSVLGARAIHELLKERQSGAPQISVTSIVEKNGDMVNFTRNYPPLSNQGEKINLLERDYFQAHLSNPALELFLSAPVRNKGTGTWTFYLTRKIRGPSGEMLGLVLAGIESQYFVDFYKEVAGPGKQYSMFHQDGINLARYPGYDSTDGMPGISFAGSRVFSTLKSGEGSAIIEPTDNAKIQDNERVLRILAPTQVLDYPLVFNVRVSEGLIFKSWRQSAMATAAIAIVLCLLVMFLTVALRKILLRNDKAIHELEVARAQAESASAAKGDFLANMSHEIRTPMNAITGLLDVLTDQHLPPEPKRLVGVIKRSAEQLIAIVNDVLDFSRLDVGQMSLHEENFELREILDSVMATARGLPGAAQIELTCVVADDVRSCFYGDRSRLTQVLLNLLSNGVKFTKRGWVKLDVRLLPTSGEFFLVAFSVADTGCGVPKELTQSIFEPFQQGMPGSLAPHEGTGLGLSISRRIARCMGGTLELLRSDDAGATFRFSVPLAWVKAPLAKRPSETLSMQPMRILVAEDTPASQLVIQMLLEGFGHSVRLVGNGEEAVAAFTQEHFDAVFLDIQMPVMDGYQAALMIRRLEGWGASVPIVALTAYAQLSDRRSALARGVTMHLAKPIRKADVGLVLAQMQQADTGQQPQAQGAGPVPARPTVTVDVTELKELFDALGPQGLVAAVNAFVQDINDTAAKLRTQAQAGDAIAVRRLAHRMKGLFSQFGAVGPARQAAQLEVDPSDDIGGAAARLLELVPVSIEEVQLASRSIQLAVA